MKHLIVEFIVHPLKNRNDFFWFLSIWPTWIISVVSTFLNVAVFFSQSVFTHKIATVYVCVCSLFFSSISQLKFVFIAQKSNSIDSLPKNQNIFNELNHKMWNTRKQTTNKTKKQISCEWSALELYQPIRGLFFKKNNKKNQLCLCSWDEWLSCDKSQLKWCCYWLANLQIKMNLLSSFHSSFYRFFGSKRRKMWDKHSINMSFIQQPLALKVACCYIVCLLTVSFIVAEALLFFLAFFSLYCSTF